MGGDQLAQLVERGLTVRQIAAELGCSATTVRRCLRRLGLQTPRMKRLAQTEAARREGATVTEAVCSRHGRTTFTRSPSGAFRCLQCRTVAVSKRRRVVKEALIAAAGGRCVLCGYARSPAALQFHHVDPIEKEFAISHKGVTRALERSLVEAKKCVLLCATCHAEVEAGMARLPEKLSD
jgi:transposase-like protein